MSFQHNSSAPGFGQAHDPFAGFSNYEQLDALNFEDTYDGLGDQLDETDDAFNDDTFGGSGGGGNDAFASAPVGKDFDFFGSTAKVADAMEEEQVRFARQQPPPKAAPPQQYNMGYGAQPSYSQNAYQPRPTRTGYEKYRDPEPVSELQVDASIWGTAPKKTATPAAAAPISQPPAAAASRKMMSLEEVEAAMRAKAKSSTPVPPQQPAAYAPPEPQFAPQESMDYRAQQSQNLYPGDAQRGLQTGSHGHPVTILQRPSSSKPTPPTGPAVPSPLAQQQVPPMGAPMQILQNPKRMSGDAARMVPNQPMHRQQNSFGRQVITHPAQIAHMTEEDKAAYLDAEARRAKRNHKIYVLSKDNGLMTPQDKSFITRIQLQQLVAATGDPGDHGTDAALAEDFYYQVLSSLRANQRLHPSQPLNNFAQTYLFQTGSRQGGMRRHGRGPENHMQRMEQQVQRAVEAAKNKPKNKQLVIEGSLGKISFSNAKTPKPLLNIKRPESSMDGSRPGSSPRPQAAAIKQKDSKSTLKDIESVYLTLMRMDDMARNLPGPPPQDGQADEEFLQKQADFQTEFQGLNAQLWDSLKVHEPIGATSIHPFIAFISYAKGKKAIPRVFRHLTHEQRTTILTMIVVHLDQLDVVRGAQVRTGEPVHLSAAMRENIELFIMAVMPSLFQLLNESELHIVTGVLGLITQNLNVDMVARTRIGLSMLTLILSRAEIIKEAGQASEQLWQQWSFQFNQFFNAIEASLASIFPGTVTSGEDIYVWQFLAAIGIGASPDEQQRLVLAVKDRVMDTVQMAKTLPADMSKQRLDNVNLFMRSIGLDVELLN